MPLTDRVVKTARPKEAEYRLADSKGLYLRVYPTGRKVWMYRSRRNGVTTTHNLGDYPEMTLLAARNATEEFTETLGQPKSKTVAEAAEAWTARHAIKTIDAVRYRFKKYMTPVIGRRELTAVHRRDVVDMLQDIADNNGKVTANKCLGDIKQLFSYAQEAGWIEGDPISSLTKKIAGGRETPRKRTATEDELKLVLEMALGSNHSAQLRWFFVVLLMTGQRSGEVRGLRLREFDGIAWTIPQERTKEKHSEQIVLLPVAGRLLLRKCFAELGAQPFAGLNISTPSHFMRVSMDFDPKLTPHDLRRTMATKMADLGVAPYVIEKCLNHKMAGVLEVYNRGQYLPERAAAWRAWCKYLLQLRRSL